MTDPKLDGLIARIAAAMGPDRALDADIVCTLKIGPTWLGNWPQGPFIIDPEGMPGRVMASYRDGSTSSLRWAAPRFTAGLEAAMTLIPDDLWWLLAKGRTRPDEPLYGVQLRHPSGTCAIAAEAEHEVFVLAICLAALKARNT